MTHSLVRNEFSHQFVFLSQLANDFQMRMEAVMNSKKEKDQQQFPQRDRIATIYEEESTASVLLHAAREKLPTIMEDDTVTAGQPTKGKSLPFWFVWSTPVSRRVRLIDFI